MRQLNLNLQHEELSDFFETEFAGVDSNKIYLPKSFSEFSGNNLSFALKGICRAWQSIGENKGIYRSSGAQISEVENQEFYEFMLLFWLQELNEIIRFNILPLFKEKVEFTDFIIGRPNILKYEIESYKSQAKFECSYTDLSYENHYLELLRDGLTEVIKRNNVKSPLSKEIQTAANQGTYLLRDIKQSKSPIENAWMIKSKRSGSKYIDLPIKLSGLEPAISFFSSYLLDSNKGIVGGVSTMSGLLFNLNYLLEYILKKSIYMQYRSLALSAKEFKDGKINEISVKGGNDFNTFKKMKPDCYGIFSKMRENLPEYIKDFYNEKIYILDAKHKFFWSKDKPAVIGRNDFYQLISYATTHNNPESRAGIFGLIGLENESELIEDMHYSSGRYINMGNNSKGALIEVKYGLEKIQIAQVPIKFGQLLFDIGRSDKVDVDKVYENFGFEVLVSLAELHLN